MWFADSGRIHISHKSITIATTPYRSPSAGALCSRCASGQPISNTVYKSRTDSTYCLLHKNTLGRPIGACTGTYPAFTFLCHFLTHETPVKVRLVTPHLGHAHAHTDQSGFGQHGYRRIHTHPHRHAHTHEPSGPCPRPSRYTHTERVGLKRMTCRISTCRSLG